MKRFLLLFLAAGLCLSLLSFAGAEKDAETPPVWPKVAAASYLNDGTIPTVSFEYTDPENRTWIEVYLLKKGEVTPNMGTIEYDGETYSVVGIQTIDPNDPNMYQLTEDGRTLLNTDIYFGNCEVPAPGEEVFLTVGLTSPETQEEELAELIPVTVPESGEAFEYSGITAEE